MLKAEKKTKKRGKKNFEAMSWSKHEILQLINEFKKQELLWNPLAQRAGSCEARKASWNHIANVFHKPVHEIRRKVGSLLSSYRKTRIDEQKGLHPFRKTWKFYKYLSFMNNRPKVRISYRKGCAKKIKNVPTPANKSYKYENDEHNEQVIDIGSEQSNESYLIDDNTHLDFSNFDPSQDYDEGDGDADGDADDNMKLDELTPIGEHQEQYFAQQNSRQSELDSLPSQQETFYSSNSFHNDVPASTILTNHNDYILNSSLLPPPPPPSSSTSTSIQCRSTIESNYSYGTPLNHSTPPIAPSTLHQYKPAHKNHLPTTNSSIFGSEPTQTSEPSLQLFRPVPKDECDAYGDYVAFKLRCYPDKIKNLVQNSINNIIFKADMGKI